MIKLAIFDFDGIFTDGSVYIDDIGNETIRCSRLDGRGIKLLMESGIRAAVISAENCPAAKERIKKLGIAESYWGISNKEKIYDALLKKYKIAPRDVCYCGDDDMDFDCMRKSGLAYAPKNAIPRIKIIATVSDFKGGSGFVRWVCDNLIKQRTNEEIN